MISSCFFLSFIVSPPSSCRDFRLFLFFKIFPLFFPSSLWSYFFVRMMLLSISHFLFLLACYLLPWPFYHPPFQIYSLPCLICIQVVFIFHFAFLLRCVLSLFELFLTCSFCHSNCLVFSSFFFPILFFLHALIPNCIVALFSLFSRCFFFSFSFLFDSFFFYLFIVISVTFVSPSLPSFHCIFTLGSRLSSFLSSSNSTEFFLYHLYFIFVFIVIHVNSISSLPLPSHPTFAFSPSPFTSPFFSSSSSSFIPVKPLSPLLCPA